MPLIHNNYTPHKRDEEHLANLQPEFASKVRRWLVSINTWAPNSGLFVGEPWTVRITDSRRDMYVQAGLWSQGRKWDEHTRRWERVGDVVTNTLSSKHLDGLAVDVAPYLKDQVPWWPSPALADGRVFWEAVAKFAATHNIVSGVNFKHPDHPHLEDK